MMAISRSLVLPALAGASALGFYTSLHNMGAIGFGDAMWKYVANPPHSGYPGAPQPVPPHPTGIAAIDTVLLVLTGFFSAMLDGDVAPQYRLYAVWGMAQFGLCWLFVALEGLRAGNKGKAVAWVCTATMIIQTVSHMATLPLWLILHVLSSPISRLGVDPSVSKSALRVDPWHLAVLPISFLICYAGPLVPMYLPPSLVSAPWHYFWIAVWQPFPMWFFIVHNVLVTSARALSAQRAAPISTEYVQSLKAVYNFITTLSAIFHLPIVALALCPDALRGSISASVPALAPFLGSAVSLRSVFAPWSPLNPPTINAATTIVSGQLAPLAVYFLHYDMYVGNGALLLWALYLHRNAVKRSSLVGIVLKTGLWFAIGGHAAAIAAVLWERDLAAETETQSERTSKKRQ